MSSEPVRLQVFLARCGVGSRRKCEAYIEEGLVRIDGEKVTIPGTKVTGAEDITFRNRKVRLETHLRYVALNKPRGFVCTNSDPQGRPTAGSILEKAYRERLFHVGRLDVGSEGLIFYSNDGAFTKVVTHPAACIEKEYLVETPNRITDEIVSTFVQGVVYNGIRYKIDGYTIIGAHRIRLRLHEGKNRELRELFRSVGYRVGKLKRVRIGTVSLASLPAKGYRDLTMKEIAWFMSQGERS
jgi:23S rRNA pseudouridine2605 synthase